MESAPGPELTQVLQGLALNRRPGWNFPGNFLDLSFDAVDEAAARVSLVPGPHCTDRDGQVHLAALCLLADVAMAVTLRRQLGVAGRLATVAMALQFTGALRTGRLEARSRLCSLSVGTAMPQGLTRATITAGGASVCLASGSFIALGNRAGLAPMPMRRRGHDLPLAPLAPADLVDEERAVYARAQAALGPRDGSFIDAFWGLHPRRQASGAVCDFDNGPQVGNRVGHAQGGISCAIAVLTAQAAFDADWQLTGASASYVSPGVGATLRVESTRLHAGRLTAVAHTTIRDPDGRVGARRGEPARAARLIGSPRSRRGCSASAFSAASGVPAWPAPRSSVRDAAAPTGVIRTALWAVVTSGSVEMRISCVQW